MKKILITAAVIFGTTAMFAQKNQVQSAYNYIKAFDRNGKCSELQNGIEAINSATQDETTKTDRKSTRLNSSHVKISYAVFCLKKKKKRQQTQKTYIYNTALH